MKIDEKYKHINVHEDCKSNHIHVHGKLNADLTSIFDTQKHGTYITKKSPDRYIDDGYKITISDQQCELERIQDGRVTSISNVMYNETMMKRPFDVHHQKHVVFAPNDEYNYWYELHNNNQCKIHRFKKQSNSPIDRFQTFFRTTTPTIILSPFETDSSVPSP
tara:strand:- start:2 stop:490 length:489 start_codon:yes stop_codon:yes gene_type:complete